MELERVADYATIISACLAVASVMFVAYQITDFKINHKEALSVATWGDYERYSMDHPELSLMADTGEFDFSRLTLDGSRENFERYEWYVSYMLWACVEIGEIKKSDDWDTTIAEQLRRHKRFLISDYIRGKSDHKKATLDMLPRAFRRKVESVVG